jgi:hypothetical protein
MALITNFRAWFRCARCGHDGTAWLYSTLGERGATYEVGDCPGDDILPIDFEDSSFTVRRPAANDPIHMLMSWTCENCKRANVGEVIFEGGCVRSIRPVDLDPSTLARLHYISADLEDRLETIIGEPLYTESGLRSDWLATLHRALDEERRW